MPVMNRLEDPSFRFLLWMEWILLGLTALGELTVRFRIFDSSRPLLSLICLGALAWLGLRLPHGGDRGDKLGYATLNLGLGMMASVVGRIQFFFLLCVVLMVRGCLLFDRQGRWMTMGLMMVVFIVVQGYRIRVLGGQQIFDNLQGVLIRPYRPLILGSVLLFILVLVFLQLLINALLAERNSREQLTEANNKLRHYALQIESVATLQERTRIAREIHDSIGHSLTALNLNLNAALGLWDQEPEEAKSLLGEAQSLSQIALQDVRQSVGTLRTEPLQNQTLEDLIQGLVAQFQQTTGIRPSYMVYLSRSLPEAQKVAAYRIVQEALTNITKYAEATAVRVQVEQTGGQMESVVQDNGRGFDRTQTTSGFGLRGMEERVLALGGRLMVETAPGQGCRIMVQLPLQ